jgi:hypothetical protein
VSRRGPLRADRALALLAGAGLVAPGCGSGGSALMAPPQVTLAQVQAQVFSPRCALSGCHVGPTAPHGLDLSSGVSASHTIGVPSAELPALMRIAPFDPAGSYLYLKLIDDPQILGDPMPLSGPALNAGELALVETWIEQGAL